MLESHMHKDTERKKSSELDATKERGVITQPVLFFLFLYLRCGGILKRLRTSSNLFPRYGVSTVTKMAL